MVLIADLHGMPCIEEECNVGIPELAREFTDAALHTALVEIEADSHVEPEAPQDKAFYAAAREILQHLRATSLTALRGHRTLEAGSFMRIISIAQPDRLHHLLAQAVVRTRWTVPKPHSIGVALPSRFLALQEMEPAVLTAAYSPRDIAPEFSPAG